MDQVRRQRSRRPRLEGKERLGHPHSMRALADKIHSAHATDGDACLAARNPLSSPSDVGDLAGERHWIKRTVVGNQILRSPKRKNEVLMIDKSAATQHTQDESSGSAQACYARASPHGEVEKSNFRFPVATHFDFHRQHPIRLVLLLSLLLLQLRRTARSPARGRRSTEAEWSSGGSASLRRELLKVTQSSRNDQGQVLRARWSHRASGWLASSGWLRSQHCAMSRVCFRLPTGRSTHC